LGFLKLNNVTANLGILDQRLAMTWVVNNIVQFGGNASRITLFGQSAGASSVAIHLTSPASWPLFHQAILESNPSGLPMNSIDIALLKGAEFARVAGCHPDNLLCLQSLSVDAVLRAQSIAGDIPGPKLSQLFMPYSPIVDGDVIPGQFVDVFASGAFLQVPIILGDVSDEGRMFIYQILSTPTRDWECDAFMDLMFGLHGPKVLKEYPNYNKSADCRPDVDQIFSDYAFTCANRNIANSIAKNSNAPLYRYWFNHVVQEYGAWGPNYTFCEGHVCHCEELPFVFGTELSFGYTPAADEIVLQQTIQSYWGNFAWTANPNNDGQPYWAEFGSTASEWLMFATPTSSMQPDVRQPQCEFWDTLGYNF